MAKVICDKCGATGRSKCPYCRNVFGEDKEDAALSWILKVFIEKGVDDLEWLTIKHFITDGGAGQSREQRILKELPALIERLQGFVDNPRLICSHHWAFAPGHHSDIGCLCEGLKGMDVVGKTAMQSDAEWHKQNDGREA